MEDGLEDGRFLKRWVKGILESGGHISGVCGIWVKLAEGSLKMDMSVHSTKGSSLSGSWSHCRLRRGGTGAKFSGSM